MLNGCWRGETMRSWRQMRLQYDNCSILTLITPTDQTEAIGQKAVAVLLLSFLLCTTPAIAGKATGPLRVNPHSHIDFGTRAYNSGFGGMPSEPKPILITNTTSSPVLVSVKMLGSNPADF